MAHIHDKIDFCAEVFIVHDGKLLLRKHDKYGYWLSIGGHIELDEDPAEAAIREVKEEVGLDVKLWDMRNRPSVDDGSYREIIPPVSIGRHPAKHPTRTDHEHVAFVYFATTENPSVSVQHDGDRSDEWKWVTKEELETLELPENVRAYGRLALDTLAS